MSFLRRGSFAERKIKKEVKKEKKLRKASSGKLALDELDIDPDIEDLGPPRAPDSNEVLAFEMHFPEGEGPGKAKQVITPEQLMSQKPFSIVQLGAGITVTLMVKNKLKFKKLKKIKLKLLQGNTAKVSILCGSRNIPVAKITDIFVGKQTVAFQGPDVKDFNRNCCCSVLAHGCEPINFVTATQNDLCSWIAGIRLALLSTGRDAVCEKAPKPGAPKPPVAKPVAAAPIAKPLVP